MDYCIVEKPGFKIAGKPVRVATKGGENFRAIPKFWSECRENGFLDTLLELESNHPVLGKGILGVCLDFADDMSEFTYMIGSEASGNTAIVGLVETSVPAATWAVFESIGPMPDAIQTVWTYIMSEFFSSTPYKHGSAPDIELYPGGDSRSADFRCEVWVPVVTK